MENKILAKLVDVARGAGCAFIQGRYVRTPKNSLVADLYGRLGFSREAQEGDIVTWLAATDSPHLAVQSHIGEDPR